MRNVAFIGLGLGFILMGAGLFALTLRKPKAPTANPSKAQQREEAALADEAKRMRIAAGGVGGFGVVLLLLAFL